MTKTKLLPIIWATLLIFSSCKESSVDNQNSFDNQYIEKDGLMIINSSPDLSLDSDLQIGDKFPSYSLPYFNGETVNLQSPQKPVLIKFWATWCHICKTIESDYEEYTSNLPENIILYDFSYDYSFSTLKTYLENNDKKRVHIYDYKKSTKSLLNNLDLVGIPTVAVIGSDGTILYKGVYNKYFIDTALEMNP